MGLEDAAPLLSRPTATHFRAAARAKRPSIRQGCALRTRAASSNGKTRQKCAQKKAFDCAHLKLQLNGRSVVRAQPADGLAGEYLMY